MHLHAILPSALLALTSIIATTSAARQPANSVLLKNVASLTLRKDLKTSHRRVSALPQLKCIGGSAEGLYDIDVLRCTNSGSGYDTNDIEWTCKASLPPEFKLGSTDVICEGYSSSDDPYILKGSCGVEYRLVLTEQGEEKYGRKSWFDSGASGNEHRSTKTDRFVSTLFWLCFLGVLGWMLYSFFTNRNANGPNPPRGGGFGGWGGGGDGNDGNDPPPPYTYDAPPRNPSTRKPSTRKPTASGGQGWRPGFWSGALGGTAAGYMMGQRGQQNRNQQQGWYGNQQPQVGSSWFGRGGGNGEGSSGTRGPGSGSSAPSSSRYESTGFGSTRRR